MTARDSTLPPCLANAQRRPLDDEDELPPWLGERHRDTTHHIHLAAHAAALDSKDTHDE
ncbi:hypothetical protein ACVCL0_09190 [Rhodanobacter sp. UC4450_H17]